MDTGDEAVARQERPEDAKAEGMYKFNVIENEQLLFPDVRGYRRCFLFYWNKLNAKRGYSWEFNPFVWVLSYPKYSEEPTRKREQ